MNADKYLNYTLGGKEWTPRFIKTLDQGKCVSCCVCVKVCPSGVFQRTVTGKIKPLGAKNCIGCTSCEKNCPVGAISCLKISEYNKNTKG